MRRIVDLPQPDGPTSTMNSPSPISSETSSTAMTSSPKTFVTPSSTICAIAIPPSVRSSVCGRAASWVKAARERDAPRRRRARAGRARAAPRRAPAAREHVHGARRARRGGRPRRSARRTVRTALRKIPPPSTTSDVEPGHPQPPDRGRRPSRRSRRPAGRRSIARDRVALRPRPRTRAAASSATPALARAGRSTSPPSPAAAGGARSARARLRASAVRSPGRPRTRIACQSAALADVASRRPSRRRSRPSAGNRYVRPSGATRRAVRPVAADDADAPGPVGPGAQHRERVVAQRAFSRSTRASEPAQDPPVVGGEVGAGEAEHAEVGDRARRRGRPRRRGARVDRGESPAPGAAWTSPPRSSSRWLGDRAPRPSTVAVAPRPAPRRSSSRRRRRRASRRGGSRQRLQLVDRRERGARRPRSPASIDRHGVAPWPRGHVCRRTTAPSPCAATPATRVAVAIVRRRPPRLPVLELDVPVDVAVAELVEHAEHPRVVVPVAERAPEPRPRVGARALGDALACLAGRRRAARRRRAAASGRGTWSGCRRGGRRRRSAARRSGLASAQRPCTKNVARTRLVASASRMRSALPGGTAAGRDARRRRSARRASPLTHGSSPSRRGGRRRASRPCAVGEPPREQLDGHDRDRRARAAGRSAPIAMSRRAGRHRRRSDDEDRDGRAGLDQLGGEREVERPSSPARSRSTIAARSGPASSSGPCRNCAVCERLGRHRRPPPSA